jgi:two-component system cell cycle sensor histidine kinase/response regulator CckA
MTDALTGKGRSPGRVLVVDGEGARRDVVAQALRAERFEVVEAACGHAAIEAARLMAPDVAVLDVCRPDLDGCELCRALKATTPALLPVLHLSSASTSSDDRARGRDAGADGYLAHPFDPNELRAAVSALVRLKRQEENLAEAVARAHASADHRARATEEVLFRSLTELSLEVVSILNTDGRFKYVSPSVERTLGYTAEELLGTSPVDLVHPEDRSTMLATFFTLVNGSPGTVAEMMVRLRRKDGSWRHFEGSGQNLLHEPTVCGITSNARDVTEREAAVRERERLVASLEIERSRLAAIFQEAPAFLAVLQGSTYVFERVNPAFLELVGHRDVVGKPVLDALPELRDQRFLELLDRVRATGKSFFGRQMPVHLAQGPVATLGTRYLDMTYQRLVGTDGEYALIVHGVDVTEHVLATEALQRSEQRLRDQFAKLPVPTYLWEARGDDFVLLECNEAAVRTDPHFAETALGKTRLELFGETDAVNPELRRCLRENIVVRRSEEFDLGASLGRRLFDLTIGPQQPDRVLVHAVDTTERTKLEAQLRQAHKMHAVGQLAGGVAHDFNNLLTVIGAHSAFLLESLDSSDPQHEDAEAIHKAGIRAAGLTKQLLAFSRKQILKPTLLDLNAKVEETRKMLERLLGEDIEIVTRLSSDLGRVVADASQIDQVLMNLAVNARDAMPDGGVLTITTRNVTMTADMPAARHIVAPGDYALLEVRDTGVGMDAAVQARLFEPFFTTKGPGKGTGLGLATVYGIVKQSAGYVMVESVPTFGAAIEVYLPLASAEGAVDERRAAEGAAVRGVETVLLIEDESAVREIAKRVLRRQGYVILEAASGSEALAVSTAFAATIHLVISDAVMPGMSGAEAVRRLKEQRPALKVLMMSGYTSDETVRRGILSSTVPFVQKPFAMGDLARAVRAALDA